MILEIVLLIELVAFMFLALGIIPFGNDKKNPLVNKMIFVFVSSILFFMMAMTAVHYQYTYCYINETIYDSVAESSLSIATCDNLNIENQGLAYLNWGMGIISALIGFITILLAGFSKNDHLDQDDESSNNI